MLTGHREEALLKCNMMLAYQVTCVGIYVCMYVCMYFSIKNANNVIIIFLKYC